MSKLPPSYIDSWDEHVARFHRLVTWNMFLEWLGGARARAKAARARELSTKLFSAQAQVQGGRAGLGSHALTEDPDPHTVRGGGGGSGSPPAPGDWQTDPSVARHKIEHAKKKAD